jgi:UDP-N-acetylglucosamine:LPS N-acetylglucosamine transferase
MGEAVYLHKPMLAIPLERQFEQVMNSRYLEKDGYGKWTRKLDDAAFLQEFIRGIPTFEENLARYQQNGNEELFGALDALLDRAAAGVL